MISSKINNPSAATEGEQHTTDTTNYNRPK